MRSRILIVILTLFLLTSCEQDVEPPRRDGFSVLVWDIIDKKAKAFRARKMDDCLKKITDEAESYVDSIIVDAINVGVLDSIQFPFKPTRPAYPDSIVLDTVFPLQ